jgi:hypothetical protein
MWLIIFALAVLLPALALAESPERSKLTLKNDQRERVTVEVVVTASPDCNALEGRINTEQFVLQKGDTQTIDFSNTAEASAIVCWRIQWSRNPDQPSLWSAWSRAILFPGQEAKTDL